MQTFTPLRSRHSELLERRMLLSVVQLVDPVFNYGDVVDPQSGALIYPDAEPALSAGQTTPATSPSTTPLSSIPALDSLPTANAKLYLDFVGAPAMTWGGFNLPATPAYDIDGDPTTFSPQELANIQQIWAQVAEAYSPFKIDVTTVDPDPVNHTNYPHRQDARIIIGGSDNWTGQSVGGISYVGAFTVSYLPNTSFVFPSSLSNNTTYIGDATAHEGGHQFGLFHQSTYSGTTLTSEYNYGTASTAPIIGCSYYSARALWWDGPNDQSSTTIQDDMSVIASATNGFGYRTEPVNTSISTAAPITLSGNNVSASGVIEHPTDADVYSFTTVAGSVSLNVNVAQYAPMLHAQAVLEDGSGDVIASADNSNSLGQTLSTTVAAGNYYLLVESYGHYGDVGQYTVTGSLPASVSPTLTSITIVPAASSLGDGQSDQFTAIAEDQFNTPLAIQPVFTWSLDPGAVGTISPTGLYSAPASGPASDTVRVTSGSVSNTATVAVNLSMIAGTSGNDIIQLVRNASNLLVYIDSALPTYTVPYASVNTLAIAGGAGTDAVTIDFSGGSNPVPVGGISIDGTGGNDSLIIVGTTGNDAATIDTNSVNFDGSLINYNALQSIVINGNGGTDSLTQTAQPANGATLTFNGTTNGGPSSNDSLKIISGTFAFAAPAVGSGVQPLSMAALSIGANALVSVQTGTARADRWVLLLDSLSLTGAGSQLDLGGNDMILRAPGSLSTITNAISSGFNLDNGDPSNGPAIISSAARNDTTHLTGLAMMQNTLGTGFDNQPISSGDILVKYTWIGDANLDGKVDASDYSRIDSAVLTHATGWSNGDFNYDGTINGSDYTLIDNAFNRQGASFSAMVSTASTGAVSAASLNSASKLKPANDLPDTTNASTLNFTSTATVFSQTVYQEITDDSSSILLQKRLKPHLIEF